MNRIIRSYLPSSELICWNYREVVNVITSPETHSVVVCCISGQQVNGGFGIDDLTKKGRGRLHHLGIRNAVAEPAGGDCFGILEFFSDKLVLRGHGGVKPVVSTVNLILCCEQRFDSTQPRRSRARQQSRQSQDWISRRSNGKKTK